jgi:hypothetical protein
MSFGDETPAPREADPLDAFPTFAELVRRRLESGRRAYGDRSFAADPRELIGELQQEALDLAGWGYVLFCRLEAMQRALHGMAGGRAESA